MTKYLGGYNLRRVYLRSYFPGLNYHLPLPAEVCSGGAGKLHTEWWPGNTQGETGKQKQPIASGVHSR